MQTTRTRIHVGADGMLELKIPTSVTETDVDVVVMVTPRAETKPESSRKEWDQFIHDTAGSIEDPTFVRHDQGEFEKRDELS